MVPGSSASPPHLHLISDSTGETLHALARAALAPFARAGEVQIHLTVFVRGKRDLDEALAKVEADPGPVWFTMVDPEMSTRIETVCTHLGVGHESVLDPLVAGLAQLLGQRPSLKPGMQHRMTDGYFDRIAALDYAISHDDGAIDGPALEGSTLAGSDPDARLGGRLMRAHVILTGISRTSKTPTCIYLAYRGIKAANVPLIPNRAPPSELFAAMKAGVPVLGLTASPARLMQVRAQRLQSLGQAARPIADYADIDRIRTEVADARLFFQRHNISVIDVTRRSIEETAAEILAELRNRGTALPETAP